MRFAVDEELTLFASSVRDVVAGWEPVREPAFGAWWDEHDDGLAARLAAVGWSRLWDDPALRGAVVAGALELGRAVAPISLVDAATLGAPLAVGSRIRHGTGAAVAACVAPGDVLALAPVGDTEREATLDGSGTLRSLSALVPGPAVADGEQRLRAWSAAMLGYLAGMAAGALDQAVAYVTAREQFGAPLASLPAVQGRLADAALAAEGIALLAWAAAVSGPEQEAVPRAALLWAGASCREVTASVLQVHGAVGFALESGLHRAYRRAASLAVWGDAVVHGAEPDAPERHDVA